MSPHTVEFVSAALCYGAFGLIALSVALGVRRNLRRPRYPEVEARYRAERRAARERDDAGWRQVMDAVMSADEPLPEDDPCVVLFPRHPRTPQQGDDHA